MRHPIYKLANKMKQKQVIKEKIRLLTSVKAKNEAAFLKIVSIDQAFATEQSRSKLYKKIKNLPKL